MNVEIPDFSLRTIIYSACKLLLKIHQNHMQIPCNAYRDMNVREHLWKEAKKTN